MDTPLMSVRLAEPVKLGGSWHKPGDVVEVTPDMANFLRNHGGLSEDQGDLGEIATGMPGFDEAVAQTAQALAEAGIEAAVDVAMAKANEVMAAVEARAAEAEAQRDLLQDRVLELQAEIEQLIAGTAAPETTTTDKTPEEKAGPTPARSAKGAKKG